MFFFWIAMMEVEVGGGGAGGGEEGIDSMAKEEGHGNQNRLP